MHDQRRTAAAVAMEIQTECLIYMERRDGIPGGTRGEIDE